MNFCTVYTANKGPKEGCYMLRMDYKTRIKIVENSKTFQDFLTDLRYKVPRVSMNHVNNWISIATDQKVFLLDCKALSKALFQQDWFKLGNEFIRKKEILKVGWNVEETIKYWQSQCSMLKKHLQELLEDKEQLMDLSKLMNANKNIFSVRPATLPQAIQMMLGGMPLDEEPAQSDWSKKPLNDPQKIYLAILSHSVLEVAQKMRDISREKGNELRVIPLAEGFRKQ